MNPVRFQSQTPVVDEHWHLCLRCGCSWDHVKSLIPKGNSLAAHQCPRCGQACNQTMDGLPPLQADGKNRVEFPDWYGKGVI